MDTTAAARIADALRAAMKDQALNGAGLAERVGRLTGQTPSPVWVSRRLGGSRPKNLIEVDPDLFVIARALEINRSDLIELVIRAVFGDPDSCGYVLTDAGREAIEAVPPRPTEAEYGSLPVLDIAALSAEPASRDAIGDAPERLDERLGYPRGTEWGDVPAAEPADRNTIAEHREHSDRGQTSPDCPYCTYAED